MSAGVGFGIRPAKRRLVDHLPTAPAGFAEADDRDPTEAEVSAQAKRERKAAKAAKAQDDAERREAGKR